MQPPPNLPWSVRTIPERDIAICGASLAILVSLVLALRSLCGLTVPCMWKALTGIPCVGCGGTRAVTMLLSGDWISAFRMNPGVAILAFAVPAATAYSLLVLMLRLNPLRLPVWGWRPAALVLLAANWVYLLLVSRP